MEQDPVLFSKSQGIATLTLNRPAKRNAFDDHTLLLLIKLLQQANQDDSVRLVILRGKGEHFCAGADIQWMQKAADYSYDDNKQDALKLAQLMQTLYQFTKPTIAVVQGSVYGGGMGLVACSDLVLADANTQFCFSETKLGLVPAVIGPYVVEAIGLRAAKHYMLTAKVFNANTALHLGLVHEIVIPSEDMNEALESIVHKLKRNGPIALQRTKEMLHHFNQPFSDPSTHIDYTAELIAKLRTSPEAKEGFNAFLAKRPPHWQTKE